MRLHKKEGVCPTFYGYWKKKVKMARPCLINGESRIVIIFFSTPLGPKKSNLFLDGLEKAKKKDLLDIALHGLDLEPNVKGSRGFCQPCGIFTCYLQNFEQNNKTKSMPSFRGLKKSK